MRLIVRDELRLFDRQTHAYAEYRAFSTLAGHDGRFDDVTIVLERPEDGHAGARKVVCRIAVTMSSGDAAEVQAVAPHPYAAIDRAVALVRRVSIQPPSPAPGPALAGQ